MSDTPPPIDILPEHWIIVRDILRKHVPHYPVWAFGSRARWTAKENSSLDIVIIGDKPVNLSFMTSLQGDLQDSTLPFKVDVVDYAELTPALQKIVETTKVVLQFSEQSSRGQAWSYVRLGDYCEKIGSGATPKGGKETYFSEGPYRLIRSQNIYNDGFKYEGLAYISHEQAKKLDSVTVNAGDVLLNITGDSVARVCSAPSDVLPARVNQHVAIIRPVQEAFDARFIRYYFAGPQQQEMLLVMASSGATRNALTKRMIESLLIPKPSLNEQEKISSILGSLDDRITLLRKTNATLESIAQALFKSWFVDFDPVRAKMEGREPEGMDADTAALFPDGFEESELGLVPRGWKVGKLGNIAEMVKKQLQPTELHSELHYIGLEHIPRKSLSLLNWDNADGLESAKNAFSMGDILFGKLRPYFHKVVIAPFDGVCSTDILVCRPRSSSYYGHTAMYLSSASLIDHADRISNGSKMPRVNWKDLAAYPIFIPPEMLAANYSETINPLILRILANVHQVQILSTLRDTLLPRLISGQLRLPEAEVAMEAVLT